jgi:AcrR family transcriptional regulator
VNNLQDKHNAQGRPPASKGEDRREHILNSALTLFAAQGIAGTTIAQIAKASGVTSAMVHYYFANREGLLDSLVAERLAPCVEYMWAGVSEETLADPRRVVTEFVERLLETVTKMPELPHLWSREILNTGGLLRERIFPLVPLEKIEAVRHSFVAAQREGRVNAGVVAGLALTSIMAVVMLPLAAQTFLDKIPLIPLLDKDTLRRHALAVLLDGLCPEENTGSQQ